MAQPAPSVTDLIHARLADATSIPGQRSDDYHLVLAIDGGGNAGVISGGIAAAFHFAGATRVFDEIRGNSSGLFVGAYLAAGNIHEGVTIYPQFNCDSRFINPWRILYGKPIMDTSYIVHQCLVTHRPLLWEALRKSTIPVWAASTNRKGQTVFLPLHGSNVPVMQQHMLATSRVPFVAQGWNTRQHDLLDGMLTASIPLVVAEGGDGWQQPRTATHTVVLRNDDITKWQLTPFGWEKYILPILALLDKPLRHLMQQRHSFNQANLDVIRANPHHHLVMGLSHGPLQAASKSAPLIWKTLGESYLLAFQQLGLPPQPYPANWREGLRYMPAHASA